jgi:hypothetical protein
MAWSTEADLDYFVVRSDGRWTAAPIPPADPIVVECTEILARLESGIGAVPPSLAPVVRPADPPQLTPLDLVGPVWMFVGLVADGALIVGNAGGEQVRLEPLDVQLLDGMTGPVVVADIGSAFGLDPSHSCERVGRLVAAGTVRVLEVAPTPPVDAAPPSDEVTVEPEPRPEPEVDTTPPAHRGPGLWDRTAAWLREAWRSSSKVARVRGMLGRTERRDPAEPRDDT